MDALGRVRGMTDRARGTRAPHAAFFAAVLVLAACSGDDEDGAPADTIATTDSTTSPTTDPPTTEQLLAGAGSHSILPTVDGERAYLADAPGWPTAEQLDPYDPGVVVLQWDQGRVDVGNGNEDSAWVHDDLRATAVALELGDQRVVMIATDTYMHFLPDADEIARRARALMPPEWASAEVLVSATHNHHGPDTAFSINPDWYEIAADEAAQAAADAVAALTPATLTVAAGTHRYGVQDVRDPIVLDPRLNTMAVDAADGSGAIATIVQWNSHPESTLGWEPQIPADQLATVCTAKGWEPDDCYADGRYLTADYPGVLRERLQASRGGEVLYLNGALGNQIGPGEAPTWVIDEAHPIGDGTTPPAGAAELSECDDRDPYLCRSFAKTESIGTQLALAVEAQLAAADPLEVGELTVRTEPFFSRLTNVGFRLLLADGDLGWQQPQFFTCEGLPVDGDCTEVGYTLEDDPVLTPLIDSQIVSGDVLRSRLVHLDLGEVGFLYMPGELPPELVVGLPDDFTTNVAAYYTEPELHATGDDYQIPGALLDLVDESITFTVGLGGDELGYWVPVNEYRLSCLDLVLPGGAKCADLAARGLIPAAEYIDGPTCKSITDDPEALAAFGADADALAAACRYGQALGRELGEPDGHYEETNAAGWDIVDDLWAAAVRLFGA